MATSNEAEEEAPRPKGSAIQWSDLDILLLSMPTPADIEESKRLWKLHAPPKYRNLLDASPEGEENQTNQT